MTTDRPYADALPDEVALEEVRRGRGTQFSPVIVDAFLRVCEHGLLDAKPVQQAVVAAPALSHAHA